MTVIIVELLLWLRGGAGGGDRVGVAATNEFAQGRIAAGAVGERGARGSRWSWDAAVSLRRAVRLCDLP